MKQRTFRVLDKATAMGISILISGGNPLIVTQIYCMKNKDQQLPWRVRVRWYTAYEFEMAKKFQRIPRKR